MPDRRTAIAAVLLAASALVMVGVAMIRNPARADRLRSSVEVSYRLDPNAADRDALCLLPGIAAGKARTMIEDRNTHGPFEGPADLERVSGIGPKTRAGIEPWVRFEPVDD